MESAVTLTKPEAITAPDCRAFVMPVNATLSVIGSKWALAVFVALVGGARRFSDLKREIEGVSQKMLTQTLRDLERDGLLRRTVTPTIPPRVDYELTDLGWEFRRPLDALARWTVGNEARIAAARARFDGGGDTFDG